jgi:hypothetical protein
MIGREKTRMTTLAVEKLDDKIIYSNPNRMLEGGFNYFGLISLALPSAKRKALYKNKYRKERHYKKLEGSN